MAPDASYGAGDGQFAFNSGQRLGHPLDFLFHGPVAPNALPMIGILVVPVGLILVDYLGSFLSGKGIQIVATGCHAPLYLFSAFPCVVTVVAGKRQVETMLKIDSGSLGLYSFRRFQGDHPQGNAHLFIPGNGNSQRGTGNDTNEQHHPHKR
jgi:hypothetical protein